VQTQQKRTLKKKHGCDVEISEQEFFDNVYFDGLPMLNRL